MIATIRVADKSFGPTSLYHNLQLTIQKGEKLAIIGRNGVGKSTLFRIMDGSDGDFEGDIIYKKGVVVASTRQEHHDVASQTAVEYILQELPQYARLKHIIETYPAHMGDNAAKQAQFADAVEQFAEHGFYHVEDEVRATLADYQLADKADAQVGTLSGGERRFIELVKLAHARADLLLIDEPTNHMDFVAKARFVKWFKNAPQAIVVISHDRDVLADVDRIVEMIDGQARSFVGNYAAYLRQNSLTTATQLQDYETSLRTITNLDKQIAWARSKKAGWSGTADKKNPFLVMENRLLKQKQEILETLNKPSFWVDQESLEQLNDKVTEKYHRYKAKNIRVQPKTPQAHRGAHLVAVEKITLGYDQPLFTGMTFAIDAGDRVELRGRNGAGKSTLIAAIMAAAAGERPPTLQAGEIVVDKKCRIGRYEQELDASYLDVTLGEAIERIYTSIGIAATEQQLMKTLSDYLFDPHVDRAKSVAQLSGGQKARLQLIRMFAGNPNLLILDEPTNHLDLPSIEELELALARYDGAILYVSHDSYFQKQIGGQWVNVGGGLE